MDILNNPLQKLYGMNLKTQARVSAVGAQSMTQAFAESALFALIEEVAPEVELAEGRKILRLGQG